MRQNLLDQLRQYTVVVADTGDMEAMEQFHPQDATTNPSLITAAAQMPQYQPIVDGVLMDARNQLGEGATDQAVASLAFQHLAIAFGKKILEIVPGRVSTEVDARLSYDTEATIALARTIVAQYDAAGIGRNHVLIKIASTWEGIRAAEVLEKEGIHCNLTLLFGLHQAIAAADAGVTLISPFVGRILDWYKKDTGKDYHGADDPGVQSVTRIYSYFKKFGYKTVVMGASFRNIGEILRARRLRSAHHLAATAVRARNHPGRSAPQARSASGQSNADRKNRRGPRDLQPHACRRPHGDRQAQGRHRGLLRRSGQARNPARQAPVRARVPGARGRVSLPPSQARSHLAQEGQPTWAARLVFARFAIEFPLCQQIWPCPLVKRNKSVNLGVKPM